jgi:hypothetical protein
LHITFQNAMLCGWCVASLCRAASDASKC